MFYSTNIPKFAKPFKEVRNTIQNKDRPIRPTIASTPDMVDSVNARI